MKSLNLKLSLLTAVLLPVSVSLIGCGDGKSLAPVSRSEEPALSTYSKEEVNADEQKLAEAKQNLDILGNFMNGLAGFASQDQKDQVTDQVKDGIQMAEAYLGKYEGKHLISGSGNTVFFLDEEKANSIKADLQKAKDALTILEGVAVNDGSNSDVAPTTAPSTQPANEAATTQPSTQPSTTQPSEDSVVIAVPSLPELSHHDMSEEQMEDADVINGDSSEEG